MAEPAAPSRKGKKRNRIQKSEFGFFLLILYFCFEYNALELTPGSRPSLPDTALITSAGASRTTLMIFTCFSR